MVHHLPAKRKKGARLWLLPAIVLCLFLFGEPLSHASAMTEEYKLKTALLYKLAKFVTWPESGNANAMGEFGICVLGRDDFGAALDALSGRRVGEQPIVIHRVGQSEGIRQQCRIVFISRSKRAFVNDIANALGDRPILTVGDSKGFAKQGGMIEFILANGRIGFRINLGRVEQAGLKIAAPLLGIASIVHERKPKR